MRDGVFATACRSARHRLRERPIFTGNRSEIVPTVPSILLAGSNSTGRPTSTSKGALLLAYNRNQVNTL